MIFEPIDLWVAKGVPEFQHRFSYVLRRFHAFILCWNYQRVSEYSHHDNSHTHVFQDFDQYLKLCEI